MGWLRGPLIRASHEYGGIFGGDGAVEVESLRAGVSPIPFQLEIRLTSWWSALYEVTFSPSSYVPHQLLLSITIECPLQDPRA